jgi:hypothetical protein
LVLFQINYDGVLLICLEREDADKFLKELHDEPTGEHYTGNTIAHKIPRDGYYWPTFFKYAHTYVRNCKPCQVSAGREKRAAIPLQPVTVSRHFEKWGLDIIGEITPSSSKTHKYVLTATDYFTKWVESIPLAHVNKKVVIQFIEKQLITRFGVPSVLVFDNTTYFSSTLLTEFSLDKGIIIRYSANYYPQGNGVAESTNKNLVRILNKMVVDNQRNWHNLLHNALWADRVTPKEAIGNSPYFLVYGQEAILSNGLYLPSLQLAQDSIGEPLSVIQQRTDTLLMLEEEGEKAKSKFIAHQQIVKRWFDKNKAKEKNFEVGDLVLKWDRENEPKGKNSKFQNLWLGPFQVAEKIGAGTYRLQNLRGEPDALPVNGQALKQYFQ